MELLEMVTFHLDKLKFVILEYFKISECCPDIKFTCDFSQATFLQHLMDNIFYIILALFGLSIVTSCLLYMFRRKSKLQTVEKLDSSSRSESVSSDLKYMINFEIDDDERLDFSLANETQQVERPIIRHNVERQVTSI